MLPYTPLISIKLIGAIAIAGNKVDISFTPRIFATPMRDSKAAEEEDWIAKNRRHLKHHAVYKKNLPRGGNGVDEEDPTWLKAKGDDFFRGGDYRSAINAYSSALDADEHMIGCYANRAGMGFYVCQCNKRYYLMNHIF